MLYTNKMKWKITLVILFSACFFIAIAKLNFNSKNDSLTQLMNNELFLKFCDEASSNSEMFQEFKRSPIYNLFHENVTFEEAQRFLSHLELYAPVLLEEDLLARLRKIDCVGGPFVHSFNSVGPFSPTTLMYLKIAGELKRIFGEMKDLCVIEIGGGSGGLCKVLHEVFNIKRYTIIDFKESAKLAKAHLQALGLEHVQFLTPDKLKLESCDLLISYNGFSESNVSLQKRLIKQFFSSAQRGYLNCSFYPKHYPLHALNKQQLMRKIKSQQSEIEIYSEEQNAFILTWGA